MSDLFKLLSEVQSELNAPKNQRNTFGKYNYRSCEDILEGVKPLLKARDMSLVISDDIAMIGDRYYVKATATIHKGDLNHSVSAMAREAAEKKGMDSAQITGATSSYARKYALNGLFAIDDSKDADTNEHAAQQSNVKQPSLAELESVIADTGYTSQQICQSWSVQSLSQIQDVAQAITTIKGWSK